MPTKKNQQPQTAAEQKTAEEVLRQIQLIVENSHDAIIGETLDGVITAWNGGARQMFGFTSEEVIGKSALFLSPPEMQDEVPKLLEKVKAGEWIADHDSVRLRKDGTKIDVALSISPIKTEAGVVIGASIVERDITARKKAEESMRQIQLIVENSHDAIIGVTLEGVMTSWNGGAKRMFGYEPMEVIGKSMAKLFLSERKDELPRLLEKVRRGEIIPDYDTVWLRKDTTQADVEFSLSPVHADVQFSLSPVHGEGGKIIGASLVGRDITVRKKAEEVLRQIKLIVEDSHDAIIGKTLDGVVTSWNGGATKMFGYAASEVIGKPMATLFPPELKDELPRLLEKVKQGEIIADYDSIWLRKDGSRADVEFSISPVHAEDGKIAGASLVGRDITERKKSERHIKELNETRNKFIAIISHQLRTPLTAVNWNLETLLNGDFGKMDEMPRKFLQVTHHASIEITRRIHNLLTAMDIEEGRVRYETGEVNLDSICAGVVSESLKRCELKNLSCAYTPTASDLPTIDGDGEKIRKAAAVLMENAIGYTKDDGKVSVTLQQKGDAARFEVSDSGIGIPKAEQHLIFNRFFRASNASAMQPDAFGLGLFIAKNFIIQHHGKIGFESVEGKGSTFWFEIPLKKT
jgi:PAS domain S-box-containing protein